MSFKSVWGFDPEEAIRAQRVFREQIGTQDSAYSSVEEQAARIPPDVYSQIAELFGMLRS